MRVPTAYLLNGVACPVSNACLSVGASATYDPDTYAVKRRAHVERWDGSKWSVPSKGAQRDAPAPGDRMPNRERLHRSRSHRQPAGHRALDWLGLVGHHGARDVRLGVTPA